MRKDLEMKMAELRKAKSAQTQEKLVYEGYLDENDYGRILPTFAWSIIPNSDDGNFYGAQGWSDNFCDLMRVHDVYDDDADAFSGRWMYFMSKMRPSKFDVRKIPTDLKTKLATYAIDEGIGLGAHFCPDYQMGLDLGWGGLLEKIDTYKALNAKTEEQKTFYEGHRRVIEAVQGWIGRHIDLLEEKYKSASDPGIQQNIKEKIVVNKNILSGKPQTMREALQWIIWFHLGSRTFNRDGAGGQLDSMLMPYYENDVKNNSIDRDQAVYYLASFLINDPVYWQIGGPDATGKDQSCEMSYIILDACEHVDSALNVTLRVFEGMDEKLYDKAVKLLVKYKAAWPRFSGDSALVEGFCNLGYSKELARERIAVGCNWMSLPGKEYTVNDLYKVNMAKVFEMAWNDMMKACGYPALAGDIRTYTHVVKGKTKPHYQEPSLELLKSFFAERLQAAVAITAEAIRFHLKNQKDNMVEFFLNMLSHGPIEKGLDVSDGGAMLYNLAIDGAAIGTVSDSFCAIEQRIVEESRISWRDLNACLRTSWDSIDGEQMRRMMKASDRYGSSERGEKWGVWISDLVSNAIVQQSDETMKFIPGLFSWANAHLFGKVVGASPDGRRFGEPISHGANPSSGFAKNGTVLEESMIIAKVQPKYGNTAPLQLEFDPFEIEGDPAEILKALIKSHFQMGGTLINVNILDKSMILEADKDPDKYPDLVVRVTGFSAYFCMLTPEFRRLVVDRVLQSA